MRYYEVKAKCGHVGRNFYVLKTFAVRAADGREAAKIAREIPRVKHHHKDAIREVNEVDAARYHEIIDTNHEDPYFLCHSRQEQRSYTEENIYQEESSTNTYVKSVNLKKVFNGKELIRKPKQFIRNNYFMEGWAY